MINLPGGEVIDLPGGWVIDLLGGWGDRPTCGVG